MSYKNANAMHRAIIIGTIVIGVIMFGMHLIGVLARAIVPGIENADTVMPIITMKVLPAWAAGIVLSAPMAAIMSTVNSVLILVSSAVVKDVYIGFVDKNASVKKVKQISFWSTTIIGVAVVILSIHPPDLLIWLNLFSFGGLEAVFIWPIVMGLYWKTGNKFGAITSMIVGMTSYIYLDRFHPNLLGMHTVVIPILLSFLMFIIVSLLTKSKVTT